MAKTTTGVFEDREDLAFAVWARHNSGHHPSSIAAATGTSERTVRRIIASGEGCHFAPWPTEPESERTNWSVPAIILFALAIWAVLGFATYGVAKFAQPPCYAQKVFVPND